jgi:ABC-type lipoprotein release transport system permease subunit
MQPDKAFHRNFLYLSGIFMVQQERYDNNLLLIPIDLARELYEYPTQVTSIELKFKEGVDGDATQQELQTLLGDAYQIQNRYEQQAEFYNMLQIEKWVTYLILSFIQLIRPLGIFDKDEIFSLVFL